MSNLYTNAKTHITTVETSVYTCPANTTAIIHALYVSNITKGTTNQTGFVTIKVKAVDLSTSFICGQTEIKTGKTLEFGNQLNLKAGEQLMTSSTLNDVLDIFASVMEYS
jgi:hypothetical protein